MSKDILQPYTATYLNKMWNFVLPEFVAHPILPGLAPALANSIYDDSNLSVTPCNGPHTICGTSNFAWTSSCIGKQYI